MSTGLSTIIVEKEGEVAALKRHNVALAAELVGVEEEVRARAFQ